MSAETRSKLVGFIQTELARGHDDVDVEKDSLVDSGIIDSLGIMKLVQFIENEFSLKIGDEDLLPDNFETVDAIVELLESKRG